MNVLTVCLGNICRSPAAQGVLEYVAALQGVDLALDSAGTAAYHLGKQPDARSINALQAVDIDISAQRARQVTEDDFYRFDWIVAMDKENLANLKALRPDDAHAKLVLFGRYRTGVDFGEVEDPYYGGEAGFTLMRQQLFDIAEDFVAHLKK